MKIIEKMILRTKARTALIGHIGKLGFLITVQGVIRQIWNRIAQRAAESGVSTLFQNLLSTWIPKSYSSNLKLFIYRLNTFFLPRFWMALGYMLYCEGYCDNRRSRSGNWWRKKLATNDEGDLQFSWERFYREIKKLLW